MDYTDLNKVIETLPGYNMLTDSMKTMALNGAMVPDVEGRWPGQDNYEPTYDVYFAALALVPFLQAQPAVTHAGSEGTSVTATPMDWGAIKAFYQGLSPIISGTGSDVLTSVPIPGASHVRRVAMNDRGGYYGDVDTDLG